MTSNDLAIVEKGCRIFNNRAGHGGGTTTEPHTTRSRLRLSSTLFEIGITHLGELVEPGGSTS
jgi:hypothetical protein